MGRIGRALVSVSDKRDLVGFVRGLVEFGVEILSTGGTAAELRRAGLPVVSVSDYTGFPEILDGRVKTLQPKIHAGILARRDLPAHLSELERLGIPTIDMVVVNLYPFEATVARTDCTLEEALENIDIGGPTLLRAAAKNFPFVTVLVDPEDYGAVLAEMRESGGSVSEGTNRRLAAKVFAHTARYDGAVADYLGAVEGSPFGATLHLAFRKAADLRYGENPHQRAALYGDFFSFCEKLHGKELSFNNILDIHSAMQLMLEFADDSEAVVAILKHNTPCGVGKAPTDVEAYRKAFRTDPDSPFGGILISNRPWSRALAETVDEIFSEVLIAPDFEPPALEILTRKRNRRLVRWNPARVPREERDCRRVFGGLLVQEPDLAMEDPARGRVVTRRSPTEAELRAMCFGLPVVKHVKSNAVVFATEDATLALAGGQTSRVDPVRIAVARARRLGIDLAGSVVASEAFFPFPDAVEEIAAAGATAVVQPGGSTRDEQVIEAADRAGLAMVFTGVRHFKH
ncbi:MAG: bifunctional purine biosynthesis protein PurH [Candidatus Binatia bacterium]|nr:MAG: bifunctional purine biosynthesis protein PurH [Candidatus Binatia bacterium]